MTLSYSSSNYCGPLRPGLNKPNSFQRGDVIDVISMNPSGLWRGRCENRIGHFKFITVELLPSRPSRDRRRNKVSESENGEKSVREILDCSGRPDSVEELLKQIGLEVTYERKSIKKSY